jgi:hypothetical protein
MLFDVDYRPVNSGVGPLRSKISQLKLTTEAIMKVRLSALPLLICLSMAATAFSQRVPKSVTVVYEDGAEVTVDDWKFLYEWKYRVDDRYYAVGRTERQELFLDLGQTTKRGITEYSDRTIPADKLAAITYSWVQDAKGRRELKNATVRCSDGETIQIPKEPHNMEPWLRPSVRLIPGAGGGWAPIVYLVGRVRREKSADFKIGLWSPSNKRSGPSETIVEIRFK